MFVTDVLFVSNVSLKPRPYWRLATIVAVSDSENSVAVFGDFSHQCGRGFSLV